MSLLPPSTAHPRRTEGKQLLTARSEGWDGFQRRPGTMGVTEDSDNPRNKAKTDRKHIEDGGLALKKAAKRTIGLLSSQRHTFDPTKSSELPAYSPRPLLTPSARLPTNPFHIELPGLGGTGLRKSESGSLLSKRRFKPSRLSSRFLNRFQINFQSSLDELAQQISTERLGMNSARQELRDFIGKKEQSVKIRHVKECVNAFRSEKLAFVYGVEFRGRYISRSHGDILKA